MLAVEREVHERAQCCNIGYKLPILSKKYVIQCSKVQESVVLWGAGLNWKGW